MLTTKVRLILLIGVASGALCYIGQLPATAGADDTASTGLGIRQRRYVADRLQRIEARIASLAASMQQTDPDRAQKLSGALQRLSQLTLSQRAATIAGLLDQLELESATAQQRAVLKDLREVLDLLVDNESTTDQLEERVRLLRKWRQELVKLHGDEQQQLRTSDMVAHPEQALRRLEKQLADVERLIAQQQKLIKQNEDVRTKDLDALAQVAASQSKLRAATEQLAKDIAAAAPHGTSQKPAKPTDGGEPGRDPQPPPDAKQPPDKPKPPGLQRKQPDQRPGDQPGSQPLRAAAGHQATAGKRLAAGRGKAGQQDQQRALAELRRARDELADAQRQLQRLTPSVLDDLADRQQGTAGDTNKLGKQMQQAGSAQSKSSPADAAGEKSDRRLQQAVKAAHKNMQDAARDLQQKQPGQAGQDQQDALDNLDKGIDEIDRQLDQLQDELDRQRLAGLLQRYQEMLARQKDVTRATALIDKRRNEQDRLGRADTIMLRRLAKEERALGEMAQQAADEIMEDGSSTILPRVAVRLHDDLVRVADRLDQRSTGRDTNLVQLEIEWTLEELIEALQQAQQEKGQGNQAGQAGQPGQQPPRADKKLIPDKAELKLLRAAQRRINRLTEGFDQQRDRQPLDDLLRCELSNLADRQAEVTRMTKTLAEQGRR